MNNQVFIETLSSKNSDYNNPEQAITTANLCNTISRDINTDSQRFIYELLQNADDASNQSGRLDIQIDFAGPYVIISHKGEAFSKIDIESISSAGDGTKAGDSNKTGFKGIGFKSVFSHSNYVIIKSGDFSFRFDKQHWINHWNNAWGIEGTWKSERRAKQKDEQLRMPWQIIPIWSELPGEVKNLASLNEYSVSTIIKYDKIEELKLAFEKLFSSSQIVLFLRSKEVRITINTEETVILEKLKTGETTSLKRNGVLLSEWLIRTDNFDIPADTQEEIAADEKSPRKLREAKRTEISFAVQLEKGKLKPVDKANRLIFTYLPTSINYDFPFLANASFLTDAGRQHLHQDVFWNNWIFKQIPIRFLSWMAELAHPSSQYKKQFLCVVPHKLGDNTELEKSFNSGFQQALDNIAFIPNLQGDLLKVNEVIYDKTHISRFISKQTVVNYLNAKRKRAFSTDSFIPYIEPISTLSRLGTEMLGVEDLEDFFVSEAFTTEHSLEENFKLISFLFEQSQKSKGEGGSNTWNETLMHTPFIFDENQNLRTPQHIYFPAVEFSDDFDTDISVIHENIITQINANNQIKSWLENLGVKEPSDISFIEKTIIAQADTYITTKNALQIGRYLFNAHKKGLLREHHYEGLQKFKLLTQQGALVSGINAYLPDFFEPELQIEKLYNRDFYVSETYFEAKDLKSEWKTFLIKIKVSQNISYFSTSHKAYKIDNSSLIYEYTKENIDKLQSENPREWNWWANTRLKVRSISLVELIVDSYSFSKLFWSSVLKQTAINPNSLFKKVEFEKYYTYERNSYFYWLLSNKRTIPTIQKSCLKASEVYSCNIPQIKDIAGRYLPVFDYDEAISPEWLHHLRIKQTIGIDEYLEILSGIWQDTALSEAVLKENQKRVGLIYEHLASLKLHSIEEEKIIEWSKENKLLAKNGNDFFYPSELSIVTVEGFRATTLAFTGKFNSEIIELLRNFGVKIIDKVTPTISNSKVEIKGLKDKILQISPLIALVAVEKSKNRKEWENEYSRIKAGLSIIRFFETSEIYLSYGNENDKQKRSSWASGDNFYYVGEWYSPRILDGLAEPLGKFLSIRYAERILTILLLESFVGGLEYLKEKGFDTSLIPDELLNPKEPEAITANRNNRAYNISDADLGRKGEMFVFEELKLFYRNKWNAPIEETDTGFRIGNSLEVIWRNISTDTNENHDFKVIETGKEIYIECKATPFSKNAEKVALFISGGELRLMENSHKYLLARVYNTTTKPEMELVKLEISGLSETVSSKVCK